MKYLTSLTILIFLSFNTLFAQQTEIEEYLRREFDASTTQGIEKELSRVLFKMKDMNLKSFKDKNDVENILIGNYGYRNSIEKIEPYKSYSKDDLEQMILEKFANNTFFQRLNGTNKSYISTTDDDNRNSFDKDFPYLRYKYEPGFRIKNIYYTDGTTEACDYDMFKEVPSKLIDKIDLEIKYPFYSDTKNIELTTQYAEYTENNNFARLVSINGNIAKLWISKDIFDKSFITVTTQSGETLDVSHFRDKVEGYSPEGIKLKNEMISVMEQISENIKNGKYADKDQALDDIVKQVPQTIWKEKLEYALLLRIKDDDNIDKINLILRENKDSVLVTTTIPNADVMSEKLGFRNWGNSIIDNSGNLILQPPLFDLYHKAGPFFTARVSKEDREDKLYKLDLKNKKLEEVSYNSYMTGLGLDKKYDYDFVEVENADTKKHGVTDLEGNIVIPLKYGSIDIAYEPYDKLFSLEENEIVYVTDSKGKIILPKEKRYRRAYMGRYFIVAYDNNYNRYVFDKNGNSLLKKNWTDRLEIKGQPDINFVKPSMIETSTKETNPLDEPLMLLSDGLTRFFINDKGEVVIRENAKHEFHHDFSEGMAIVKQRGKGKYGYIDTTGKLVIPLIYDDATTFYKGYAKVIKDGKSFYIDKQNKAFEKRSVEFERPKSPSPDIMMSY